MQDGRPRSGPNDTQAEPDSRTGSGMFGEAPGAIIKTLRERLAELRGIEDKRIVAIAAECEDLLSEIQDGLDAIESRSSPPES